MTLIHAFSLDLKENISIISAKKKFAEGFITSKQNFQCPDPNCDARVTCANLGRPVKGIKVSPHFRVIGMHSNECKIAKDFTKKENLNAKKHNVGTISQYESDSYSLNLDINLKANNDPKKENEGDGFSNGFSKIKKNKINNIIVKKRNLRLSVVVDKYLGNCNDEISMPDGTIISTDDLFIKIDGQDITRLPKSLRIYHGLAWVNNVKNNNFSIRFNNCLRVDDREIRPSFLINSRIIENLDKKSSLYEDLLTNSGGLEGKNKVKPITVYIVSTPPSVLNNENKKGKQTTIFLNFQLKGLQYLEYR
ncbi:hypothetical protein [Bartonella sp. HY406]|uniref:hypothetical protein n=1 Tax=Bartonella sp. HY406 TaxID=2979331 RepID=UPI0021C8BE63|nr:hypothetical protein [Bartonella sp. HY406]UXN03652.1 hypothetical protein N6B01_00975 [Bartonella sp. HY406]